MDKLLYTVDEVGKLTGLGRTLIYQCLKDRRLESIQIGTSRRVPADALTRFVTRLRMEQNGEAVSAPSARQGTSQ